MKKPQTRPFITSPTAEPPDRHQESIGNERTKSAKRAVSEDSHDLDDWLIAEAD
jgi:hypothetical protein